MPSLNINSQSNNYLISVKENFSFKFNVEELDLIVQSCLSINKNVVYLKGNNSLFKVKNQESLENKSDYLFIPHRLKKQFKSVGEYL